MGVLSPSWGHRAQNPSTRDRGCPYLGAEGWRNDGGDTEEMVVEGDLLGRVVPHGPYHQHIAVAVIHEALRVRGC